MQKIIAVIMVLVSSTLSVYAPPEELRDLTFPGIVCMLGLIGLQRKFTWDIKPQRRIISTLLPFLLLIIFALHYRFGGPRFNPTAHMAWQTIMHYFLALMILVLFLGTPQKLPSSLGLYHLANTICAGQLLLLEGLDAVYRPLELLSVVLVAFYFTSMHLTRETDSPSGARSRIVLCYASGAALIVTLNIGWVLGSVMYRHQARLDVLNAWFWGQQNVMLSPGGPESMIGFSGSGKLSNLLQLKQDQDNLVALHIDCDECPGYLRAKAFDQYIPSNSRWVDQSVAEDRVSRQNSPFRLGGRGHTFHLNRRVDTSRCRKMTIQHRQLFRDVMFTPLGAASLVGFFRTLMYDDDHIVWKQHRQRTLEYDVWYNRAQYDKPPQGQQERRMRKVSGRLDPRIKRLAEERVFPGCETSADKIKAVKQYFRENYSYSLAMDIPANREKLTAFLLDEQSGYCEYFASGAAILLRYAGIHTRYVTGFLVTEKDPLTREWVAKNENAHAWVEAWNAEEGQWEIVEATPQEELASAVLDDDANAAGARLIWLRQFLDAFYLYGFAGPVVWLFEHNSLLITVPAVFLLLVLVTVLIRRYFARQQHAETHPPQVLRLHQMLRRADLFLKKRGLIRHESETLPAFAERLQRGSVDRRLNPDMAQWYLDYAGIRYCREISADHLQRLSQGLKKLV